MVLWVPSTERPITSRYDAVAPPGRVVSSDTATWATYFASANCLGSSGRTPPRRRAMKSSPADRLRFRSLDRRTAQQHIVAYLHPPTQLDQRNHEHARRVCSGPRDRGGAHRLCAGPAAGVTREISGERPALPLDYFVLVHELPRSRTGRSQLEGAPTSATAGAECCYAGGGVGPAARTPPAAVPRQPHEQGGRGRLAMYARQSSP